MKIGDRVACSHLGDVHMATVDIVRATEFHVVYDTPIPRTGGTVDKDGWWATGAPEVELEVELPPTLELETETE